MKVYTFQIGDGNGQDIEAVLHAETLGADNLVQAIAKAKAITNARPWRKDENTVRLFEELEGDSQIMWFRPVEIVRDA